MNNKEYWTTMIGIIAFIFGTYAITKDLVNEKTVPIITMFFNSPTESAIVYAGLFDIILIVGLVLFRKTIFKNL